MFLGLGMQGGAEPDRSEAQAAPEPETKGVASKPQGGKSRPQTAVSAHAAGRLDRKQWPSAGKTSANRASRIHCCWEYRVVKTLWKIICSFLHKQTYTYHMT